MAASTFAVETQIGGLWYDIVSKTKGAKVLKFKNDVKYKGDIVIPETVTYDGESYPVTAIDVQAFTNCTEISSVTIPTSMKTIGNNAFYRAKNIKVVNISDLSAWCRIEFGNGSSNPTYEAHHLYLKGEEITDLVIPAGVTSILNHTFRNCIAITSVTIHPEVASIGVYAFAECNNLRSVYISDLKAWCNAPAAISADHSIFLNGEKITNLVIPNGVKAIGDNAFSQCPDIVSISLPNSVTSIGENAFQNCRSLTSVTIPGSVKSIGAYAFRDCSALQSANISHGVETIGNGVFFNDDALVTVNIPNSVKSIGSACFDSCNSLASITIPNSVTSIGDKCFHDCSSLTSITIPNSITVIPSTAFSICIYNLLYINYFCL